MKMIFFFILFNFSGNFLKGQTFLVRDSEKKKFCIIELNTDEKNKHHFSINDYIIDFSLINGVLYYCTASKVIGYNYKKDHSKIVFDTTSIIYDAAFSSTNIFVATSENEAEKYFNGKLLLINKGNILLINKDDKNRNYNNLCVNSDGQYLAFYQISNSNFADPSYNQEIFLSLYNARLNSIDTIDYSNRKTKLQFKLTESSFLSWFKNNLFYLKHDIKTKEVFLFKYDVEKKKKRFIRKLPENIQYTGIKVVNDSILFTTGKKIGMIKNNDIGWLYKCGQKQFIYLNKIF